MYQISINFQGKMSSERQPLLLNAEVQGKSARPRPDIRCSPESTIVDVKSEDDGKCFYFNLLSSIKS